VGIKVFNVLPAEIKKLIHNVKKFRRVVKILFIQVYFIRCKNILITVNCK
jgi:hypothetical protein